MRQEKGSEPVQPRTRGQKMEAQAEAEEAEWTRLRGVVTLWLLYNSFYVTLRNKKFDRSPANPFRGAEEANTLNFIRDSGLIAAQIAAGLLFTLPWGSFTLQIPVSAASG
jgi:hypothetical protein